MKLEEKTNQIEEEKKAAEEAEKPREKVKKPKFVEKVKEANDATNDCTLFVRNIAWDVN